MKGTLRVTGDTGLKISDSFFGGNFLFQVDSLEPEADYLDVIRKLNITHLRYPGGSVTEQAFDVRDWDATSDPSQMAEGKDLVPLSQYLSFIQTHGLATSLVLPTSTLFVGDRDATSNNPRDLDYDQIQATLDLVRMSLSTDDSRVEKANIFAIEIGNEYWGSGLMTSAEYGKLVNHLAPELRKLIDGLEADGLLHPDFEMPKIISQFGGVWAHEFKQGGYREFAPDGSAWRWTDKLKAAHDDLADQLGAEARQAIDGIVEHYYYLKNMQDTFSFAGDFSEKRSINTQLNFWGDEPGMKEDLEFHVTEWNVQTQNRTSLGLAGVSVTYQQIQYMLEMGVDTAQVWALEHNTSTNLYGNQQRDELTIQGEGWSLMSEVLVGATLLDDNFFGQDFEISAYENDGNTHVFIALRDDSAQRLELDVSELLGAGIHVSGTLLGVDEYSANGSHYLGSHGGWIDTPIYMEHDARPLLSKLDSEELLDNTETVTLDFKPFEVLRLDFVQDHRGMEIVGHQNAPSGEYGYQIDDNISGGRGHDYINGGIGNDELSGGLGDDELVGGAGNDTSHGGSGDDLLDAGGGNDLLDGGAGSDDMAGGEGSDTLKGGSGADRLSGGRGNDELWGDSGADTFIYSLGDGQDVIHDFQIGVDIIELEQSLWGGGLSQQEVVDTFFLAGEFSFSSEMSIKLEAVDNFYGLADSLLLV